MKEKELTRWEKMMKEEMIMEKENFAKWLKGIDTEWESMESIFEKWLCDYWFEPDEIEEVNVEECKILYWLDDVNDYVEIELNAAIHLPLDRREHIRVAGSKYISFEEFIKCIRKAHIIKGKDVLYYMTRENYNNARKQVEEIFSEFESESNKLYFYCESMMLALDTQFYDHNDLRNRIGNVLTKIYYKYNRRSFDYGDIKDRILKCYKENHSEAEVKY